MTSQDEEKVKLFKKCKESVEDVFGWRVFIFLPQVFGWRMFIAGVVFVSYIICTAEVFYSTNSEVSGIIAILCEIFYGIDTICATLHYIMANTRKLRHKKRRHLILLIADYISLLPFDLIEQYIIYKKSPQNTTALQMNVCLRIYQIYMTFSEVKQSMIKLRNYFIIIFFEIITYAMLLNHILSSITFYSLDEDYKDSCKNNLVYCIWDNQLTTLFLLCRTFVPPLGNYSLEDHKWILCLDLLAGFLFTHTYVIPLLIFINIKYAGVSIRVLSKKKRLNLLIENTIEDKALKEKTSNAFDSTWKYGTDDRPPSLLCFFPLCFQKSIFCDIYWEAMRHSDFLQDLSNGCKRSLSLVMRTEFVLPKTVFIKKNGLKNRLIYLKSGMLQIISEECDSCPVVAFSGGTVLGEMSLFLQTESKAIMRAGKFSIIHVLYFRDLFRTLLGYPKDLKKLISRMKLRLKIARAAHKRRMEISPQFLADSVAGLKKNERLDNIKWIKHQYRAIFELHKSGLLSKTNQFQEKSVQYQRLMQNLCTNFEKSTAFLSLLAVDDDIVSKYDTVCLKSTFPWIIHPQSNFLVVWNRIILVVILISALIYPASTCWVPVVPIWFFNISAVTSFIYIIDVIIQSLTAVEIKNVVITKMSAMMSNRLSSVEYLVDVLAAIPLQGFYARHKNKRPYELNYVFTNALLKSYRLLFCLSKWNYKTKSTVILRTFVKYFLIFFTSIYITASYINLYQKTIATGNQDPLFKNDGDYAPVFESFFWAMSISINHFDVNQISMRIIFSIGFVVFYVFFLIFQAESVSTILLVTSYELGYKNLMEFVANFMSTRGLVGRLQKRVMDTMEFQWYYDYGDYLTQSNRLLDDLPTELKEEIDRKYLLPTLSRSVLFDSEDESLLLRACSRIQRLSLPANSVLTKFGVQTMSIYMIHKGYVQVNSFWPEDLIGNVATPLLLKRGDTFPIVVALKQRPSVVAAVTLTDCELLVFGLEEMVSLMLVTGMFRDVVDAVKEVDDFNFDRARLGFSVIQKPREVFVKAKCLYRILTAFLLKKAINSQSLSYIRWEFVQVAIVFINLLSWPMLYGTFVDMDSMVPIKVILVIDSVSLVDFYIRLHVAFYVKRGIYIARPLATALHYLTSAFVVDLLAFCPNLHVLYLGSRMRNMSSSVRILHMCLRTLSAYRVFGFINSVVDFKKPSYKKSFYKYCFITFLIFHYYVNISVYGCIKNEEKPRFSFSENSAFTLHNPIMLYLYEFKLSVLIALRTPFHFEEINLYTYANITLLAAFGWIIYFLFLSYLSLLAIDGRLTFITYQYYTKSLKNYLNEEKVDDTLFNAAIHQVEHAWKEEKGMDFQKIFSRFPDILHEDIMFPGYKMTLSAVGCLSQANDAFYRIISRNVREIHYMKGSVVIFPNQAQGDIFFVHKGQCVVEGSSKTLFKGSMIGNIRQSGITINKVTAETHVLLLKISSDVFFSTMSNFYETKRIFDAEVADVEDFVQSIYYVEKKQEDPSTGQPERDSNEIIESEFEAAVDFKDPEEPEGAKMKKSRQFCQKVINPDSVKSRIFTYFILLVGYATFLVIPILIGIRFISKVTLLAVYTLDALWILKIVVTLRTGYRDQKTGNYITDRNAILHRYLHDFNGLIIDVISVLPLELIPLTYYTVKNLQNSCRVVTLFYSTRLLRFFHVHKFTRTEMNKLSINFYVRLGFILGLEFSLLIVFVGFVLVIFADKEKQRSDCYRTFTEGDWDYVAWSLLCALNIFANAGKYICLPDSEALLIWRFFAEIFCHVSKGLLVNQILKIIYVSNYKYGEKFKLDELENYLSVRDVSPSLLLRTRKYFCDLTSTYSEASTPSSLMRLPPFLRVSIMENIYVNDLNNCYVFQGLSSTFLNQLAARLERVVFFPGDYITEKGDVDRSIFFVHKGEIYAIELDTTYSALEIVVNLYVAGESFGVKQGIFAACPYDYSYRAKTLAEVMVLTYDSWEDLRKAFPEITQTINTKAMVFL